MKSDELDAYLKARSIPELEAIMATAEQLISYKRNSGVIDLALQFEAIASAQLGMTVKQVMCTARKAERERGGDEDEAEAQVA